MANPQTRIPEGSYCDIANGLQLHYHEAGEGPVVVFVHGSGPGASGYSNFKQNYQVFADAGFRVIVPDLIGYGYSSKPTTQDYTLDFFVSTLKDLIDALGVTSCTLVGNSLGGAISIKLALDDPDLVDSLIMMAPGGIEDLETYMAMPGIQKMMSGFLTGALDREGLRRLLSMLVYDDTHVTNGLVDERLVVLETQPKEVLGTMKVPNLESELGKLTCPILGFWGHNDEFCPASGAQKFLNACTQTRFTIVTECGHWVMVEHAELFNRECLAFLQQHSRR